MILPCPICNKPPKKTNIIHEVINLSYLYYCKDCDYNFINCSKYSSNDIFKHQSDNSVYFGGNLERNDEYLDFLINIKAKYNINSILEIGTPSNYDFLKKVHNKFKSSILIYSYDIIKSDFPDYIKFYTNKNDILSKNIDILFCIHTLEHIPTNELIDFVEFCKKVSKFFVFEVPYCKDNEIIIESTGYPHYSFFTKKSIISLFSNNINIDMPTNRILKFNNLK